MPIWELALERELGVREVPAAQRREVLLAEAGELVEELLQVLPCTVVRVREAVERLEAAVCVLGEDDAGARDPVGAFTVDEMADVVERGERVRTLVRLDPWFGQAAQQSAQRDGCSFEDGDGFTQFEAHDVLPIESRTQAQRNVSEGAAPSSRQRTRIPRITAGAAGERRRTPLPARRTERRGARWR